MANFSRNWLLKILFLLLIQSVLSTENGIYSEISHEPFKKRFIDATNKCAAKANIMPVNILQILTEEGPASIPVTEDTKCYLLCLFQELDMMDDKANYQVDSIQDMVKTLSTSHFANVLRDNLAECLHEEAIQPCEKAYKFAKCFYDHRQVIQEMDPSLRKSEDSRLADKDKIRQTEDL